MSPTFSTLQAPARTPGVFLLLLAIGIFPAIADAATPVLFNREIKPILSENCYACHGPDPGTRKAGLRLDTRDGLFAPTPKRGAVVVPGQPDASELWKRVIADDKDEVMPPPESHKTLTGAQKDLLKRWIGGGADWQPHWSFIRPERPPVPDVSKLTTGPSGFEIRNPIDAFVLAKLAAKGLAPSPEADRRTLARRLSLDLTGLPPAPEEVEAFVNDSSTDAYRSLLRKWMNSVRWGEHRARYWLDAARYADTHGLHFDNYREMWPYRDWVIRAFNRNQGFDAFTVEQLAGDLLENPTDAQLVATGFHRCNATTNEGGTIEEENLVNYANDRVTTTSWLWLGLTANCAACHDHKFDPLTSRDFYSLAAFFRNTTQSGFDGNVKDGGNAAMSVVEDGRDRTRWAALPGELDAAKRTTEQRRDEAKVPFDPWASALTPAKVERDLQSGLSLHTPLTEGAGSDVSGNAASDSRRFRVEGEVRWQETGHDGASLHFEKGGSVNLEGFGDFDLGQAFAYGAWVYVPTNFNETASILARMDEARDYRGWDLWIQQGQFAAHFVNQWPGNALKVRTKKRLARQGEWQHVFVTFDGTGTAEGTKIYVDGAAAEIEAEGRSRVRGSIRTETPLRLGRRSVGSGFTGGAVQDFRLYARALAGFELRALAQKNEVRTLLETPFAEWKPEAREEVFEYFLLNHPPFQQARSALVTIEKEKETIQLRHPLTHVQREKGDAQPMAAILFRGQYDQPKDKVMAATPPVLHPWPSGAPTNRLGLARWLVSSENPLAARVTVNRFWQELFGVGLVRTSEDFGIMGEPPVNSELLDWLAVEFVENGWDVKHLYELIVTSSTYRQSAVTTPEKLEKDPANRWLSRGPRFRLDAEMIRDYALTASGLLDPAIGGPSVKPYQPDGVWEAVAMRESNTRNYQRDSGAALYRRSLYTFWKRSAPPALMDLFNAPSRETCTVRRERTNTPLQALATLNDPQFIEAARFLAERAFLRSDRNRDATLELMARRILLRPLFPEELREVAATLHEMEAFYDQQPAEAGKLLTVGERPPDNTIPAPTLAALTMVANQLFNLDEALTK